MLQWILGVQPAPADDFTTAILIENPEKNTVAGSLPSREHIPPRENPKSSSEVLWNGIC